MLMISLTDDVYPSEVYLEPFPGVLAGEQLATMKLKTTSNNMNAIK